ncbi:putative receptor-like protein kinase isoform X2 [Cinnamomum micranthum f. kanehirae]|uniref:non-specific serine/threonine protein kinase n=1 Tax=Cinnamomum micranthum f. kanehirae TaxID=337451 RepID=A0A3S3Q8Z2_9MAGN|nr:putative receptor-like protein kinase isoform X2 [Cinnamomum micranthum f. kanehirae]
MKCFHFPREEDEDGGTVISRVSKVSWVRSLSVASSTAETRRSEFASESRDFSDSAAASDSVSGSGDLFSQRRSNDLRVFRFAELRLATRGFSRALMIGEGGFGCVYRGAIRVSEFDGSDSTIDVAVKQLNRNGLQGHKEWITEVNFLGVVNHPNLVKLVGYCAEDDERGIQRLLVYELMPNKSLEDHLLARVPSSPLSWSMRLRIAQDAARGLAYLHEEMDFQLIFRDFKTSNILLDEHFNAKLSDFGLAREGPAEGLGHVSTSVVGTVGYAAPEYIHTGRLTAKSDVWSFGVVLYELITGRRSVDRNLPRSEQKLLEWVKPYISDSKKFYIIIDPRLEGQYCIKSVQKLIALANKCLMKQPKSRPKMSEVVEVLGHIIETSDSRNLPSVTEAGPIKEDVASSTESKEGSNYLRRVFDFREMRSLRSKTSGKLDWRGWRPGLVRTW